jgi:hypothetical protein
MIEHGQIVTDYLYIRHVEEIRVELISTWSTRQIDLHDESKGWDCEMMTIRRITWASGKQETQPVSHEKFEGMPQNLRARCLKIHADCLPWLGM